ncbi:hypothetical protein BC831DRAFT_485836 [Entophlyctis helioformis]|nr:hypothetical protein BC831DRAFT_485836 [Entophlyctis helioformis]
MNRLQAITNHLQPASASVLASPAKAAGHAMLLAPSSSLARSSSSSSSSTGLVSKALTYAQIGSPSKVLSVKTIAVRPHGPTQVLLKILAAPVNPADVNIIQGTYPVKPTFEDGVQVGGNEGVCEVVSVGASVTDLKPGDWVIPLGREFGTWQTYATSESSQLLKLNNVQGVPAVLAATISVNPPTAYRMIKDFAKLQPGDVILQNSANSGVGQAVIQLARAWGYKTVNVIRDRPNVEELVKQLTELGADMVITEEQVRLPETAKRIAALGPPPKLGLNGVGGKSATNLARLLGDHAYFITYGGMSKEPVTLPTSLYIFKDLRCQGFWMNKWYLTHTLADRQAILSDLFDLVRAGKFKEPIADVLSISQRPDAELVTAVSGSLDGFLKGKPIFVP